MIAIAAPTRRPSVAVAEVRPVVVAAVHSGSQRLDAVIARAWARSVEVAGELVFVTVLTRRAASNEVFTMRMRLARCPWPVRLEVATADCEGLSRRQRAAKVAEVLAAEARRLGAGSIVVGHDCLATTPERGVTGRLVASLPSDIDLCFGLPEVNYSADADADADAEGRDAVTSGRKADVVHLTDDGRRLLAARVARIERHEIPKARARLRRHAESAEVARAYEVLVNDLRGLSYLVQHAPRTADLPDDPHRVELGEQVSLEIEGGGQRRLLVVDPIEVTRGRSCVSATSGLGRAILGGRVGDRTAIPTARGPRLARILSATR
jgi:transcription elongation GreA/GreB family factor